MGVGVANEMVGVAIGVGRGAVVAVGVGIGVWVGVAVGSGVEVGIKVGMSVGRGVWVGGAAPSQAASTSREKKSPTDKNAWTPTLRENRRQTAMYVRCAARPALDQSQFSNSIYLPLQDKNLPLRCL